MKRTEYRRGNVTLSITDTQSVYNIVFDFLTMQCRQTNVRLSVYKMVTKKFRNCYEQLTNHIKYKSDGTAYMCITFDAYTTTDLSKAVVRAPEVD